MATIQRFSFAKANSQMTSRLFHAPLPYVLLLLGALALFVAACSSPPKPPPPTLIAAQVSAADTLNADVRGRPSPVIVRIYELSNRSTFDTLDFVSLYEREKETLGAELVSREELVMRPGESRDWNKAPAAETKFVGVLVAFREIERARWRTVVPVKPHATNNWLVSIEALAVSVAPR